MDIETLTTENEFKAELDRQRGITIVRLNTDLIGSDELSALIKAVLRNALIDRVYVTPTLSKWMSYWMWRLDPITFAIGPHELHTMLTPYSTSMDTIVPGENIVMLTKQHIVPGKDIARWSALQEGAKVAHLANDRILACRLNALHAYLEHAPWSWLAKSRTPPRAEGDFSPAVDDEAGL